MNNNETTPFFCMTPAQKAEAKEFVSALVGHCLSEIKERGRRITAMDGRPHQVYTKEQPDVFFWYVDQNLLEELVSRLAEQI